MNSRQEEFSGTVAVRDAHRFDESRLLTWMQDNVSAFRGPMQVAQFRGGQSNPTFVIATPDKSYVLRKKPPGELAKSAHAVDREYRVITALYANEFPVARSYGFCADETVIGTPFYVMDLVEGKIHWDATFPEVSQHQRPRYFDAMNATLARLHMIDAVSVGLGDFGKAGNYFLRQIGRWSKQYTADEIAGRVPSIERLIEWLPLNVPPGDEISIVHGDFRCDNVIFHRDEAKIVAVLDWELSTIGHPLADFAYHLMMYRIPSIGTSGLLGVNFAALNIPSEKEYIDAYCRRTGRSGGIPDIDFYLTYNLFRMAAIVHGIRARMARGNAASEHARKLSAAVEPLAEIAWQQALKSRERT
jgi:aminoglycoside phosphotransferase (APT) family kinase protein